ncbi:YdcF family protein [Roseibium sp.]|uniref:YdcF family protein n=1 Tax=Roseibium sp. TaxID=1936156 RepID=UPI003A97AF49
MIFALGFVGLSVSFLNFAGTVGASSAPDDPRADAIVVLTGGTERVERAVALLVEGRASRLLISGVHPGTTQQQIATMTSGDLPLFECCVDLDRVALNTTGNALETASWVQEHGFRSLLVVTSAYHLPRASLELAEVLPNVELVPYPVYQPRLDLRSWYRSPKTIRLLLREYVKYTLARLRIVVSRGSGMFSNT